jgi:hypothetical protein
MPVRKSAVPVISKIIQVFMVTSAFIGVTLLIIGLGLVRHAIKMDPGRDFAQVENGCRVIGAKFSAENVTRHVCSAFTARADGGIGRGACIRKQAQEVCVNNWDFVFSPAGTFDGAQYNARRWSEDRCVNCGCSNATRPADSFGAPLALPNSTARPFVAASNATCWKPAVAVSDLPSGDGLGYICANAACWKLFDPAVEARQKQIEAGEFVLGGVLFLVLGFVMCTCCLSPDARAKPWVLAICFVCTMSTTKESDGEGVELNGADTGQLRDDCIELDHQTAKRLTA